ncbi:YjbH domain-containing protein [Phaeobacter sp. PT47_59]|uniref:YjbH domain-containing protein n=1 Tax=Phaeobacter sp. PT47_59 TaxID=3029979 RepID=UPI0023800A94|nr:YjbH domain-containing protein [Phaeobacter sp. PT47_59]MDE4175199.1 YjbH domain-containing protein [Phaeobacter sp. PT47_59]
MFWRRAGGLFLGLLLMPFLAGGAAQAQSAPGADGFASAARVGAHEAPSLTPPPTPGLNFYGTPGLIDMPSAEMLPDGHFATTLSWFGGQSRYNLTFQALPWLSASFRYNGIRNLNLFGFSTYYDRGFDVRFRLLRERRYLPELTMGLQDFAGTGVYAAEYLVATKRIETPPLRFGGAAGRVPGQLKITAGLGWGRLGSHGAIGKTGGNRPSFVGGSTGGQLSYDQWFRGDFAPFAGVEWQANERWSFKAEYSSDAYRTETRASNVFERKSQVNLGLEYQRSPTTRIGAYYLYGSEFGVTAQFQLKPRHPMVPTQVPAPAPIVPRSQWATEEAHWSQDWAQSQNKRVEVRDLVAEDLKSHGLVLEAIDLKGTEAEVRFRNPRYRSYAIAVGRVARTMARALPPSVETFRIIPVRSGMGLSATVVRRSDLEDLEFAPEAVDGLAAVTAVTAAGPLPETAIFSGELYPAFSHSISPYADPAYFDPSRPFRMDLGVDLSASYAPTPGWRISGTIRQRVWGNVQDGRASNSVLPHVRTDQSFYAQHGTTLESLYVDRSWQPRHNFYARLRAGLFEAMYGGISGEVLWKPVSSPLALGLETNYVIQRDYDQRFSFRDYKTFTGHASAYLELGGNYQAQVDVGRYLAGDYGATFSLFREFENGFKVGGFFTRTNVSAADFGEGSFDKGFYFRIPLGWLIGKESRNAYGLTIRPIQRDGGQRVGGVGGLYGDVRDAHRSSLTAQRARAWE